MASDEPEFPEPTAMEAEAIASIINNQSAFMADYKFFTQPNTYHSKFRILAVSQIARIWRNVDIDAFVPYLAMNYYDRYVSKTEKPYTFKKETEEDPYEDIDEVPLIAHACLNMAAKMRGLSPDSFAVLGFVKEYNEAVSKWEGRVLVGLNFQTHTVTAFLFLNHFYPIFEKLGGFKRRSINQMIVQAQGENYYIQFKPSEIAFSSLLCATAFVYPLKYHEIVRPRGMKLCDSNLMRLCTVNNIVIKSATESEDTSSVSETVAISQGQSEGGPKTETKSDQQRPGKEVAETSEEVKEAETESEKKQRQDKGKAVVPAAETVEEKKMQPFAELEAPKRLMNFVLHWKIGNPLLERCLEVDPTGSTSENVPMEPPLVMRRVGGDDVPRNSGCGCKCM